MATDVEATLEAQIAQFRRDADMAAVEEEAARQRRTRAQAQAQEYESALRIVREALGIRPASTGNVPLPFGEEIPNGTIAQMAAAYMRRHGGEASVTALVTFLRDRGKFVGTNQHGFYGTVFGTLRKQPDLFARVPGKKGTFMLVEFKTNGPKHASNGAAAPVLEPSGAGTEALFSR